MGSCGLFDFCSKNPSGEILHPHESPNVTPHFNTDICLTTPTLLVLCAALTVSKRSLHVNEKILEAFEGFLKPPRNPAC